MKLLKILAFVFAAFVLIYLFGPSPKKPEYNMALQSIPSSFDSLENYIADHEKLHNIKPGNEAKILWLDSSHKKTAYAIVYLHGFSASREEGNPVHTDIAQKFGCNLYLSRLSQHGIDTSEELVNLTADNLWESAKEALAIGKKIGDKVIIMGTSTGGSLAIQLAACYPEVEAILLLSPNIAINNPNAWMLNNPWGLQISRLVEGSNYHTVSETSSQYKKFWNYRYRNEALVQLEEYLETAMTKETFAKVKQPVLSLYYYKDEQHQDPVVKVTAIKSMMNAIGTPDKLKRERAVPNAGNHVLGSYIVSHDIPQVEAEITLFLSDILNLKPLQIK